MAARLGLGRRAALGGKVVDVLVTKGVVTLLAAGVCIIVGIVIGVGVPVAVDVLVADGVIVVVHVPVTMGNG